ncbi:hypothetical protein [Brucella sp. NBRC 12950]|uniref:hypothetical protein n=1 Tax=Brucella sp. NBRC 12950 TaxID=2994518 RepID=UPI0024A167C6|nr:hypothetical protein [Brucella sp. NBRC 12950]GLU25542.1 hypothetical protein Brsp01_07750 [Brucella sp. NBRC 12950]
MDVLEDFKNRTVKSVRNLRWENADKTCFTADVVFVELETILGEIPFSTTDNADTRHGVEVWEKGISGEYGSIAEYTKPETPNGPIPDDISRRQFFQQLFVLEIITKAEALTAIPGLNIPSPLQAIIDQLPTQSDRDSAEMLVLGAQNFNRLHPLSETVRLSLGWSVEQKDDFWREAVKL